MPLLPRGQRKKQREQWVLTVKGRDTSVQEEHAGRKLSSPRATWCSIKQMLRRSTACNRLTTGSSRIGESEMLFSGANVCKLK
jgi:hypothetical protein